MKTLERTDPRALLEEMRAQHAHWEKIKDLVDSMIDMMLNYRQSGHPGGSRSKVHLLVATLLGGIMRWDVRHPEKPFGDRFVHGWIRDNPALADLRAARFELRLH